ncbi:uncharacterized protein [Spinacia oleracea]|uniref:Transposase Tnp1/En/Spm-like domain-containing protein n=1 Tax=Spinacia oleracea TaxID=3562 RepID=A0ABM3R9F2_SPIOL|nr:uncharacterized protein LOC130467689 [Spinacia oleracea]
MSGERDSDNVLSGAGYDDADPASTSEDVNFEDDDKPSASDYFEPSYEDAAKELQAHMRKQDAVRGAHLEDVAGGSRQMDEGEVSSRANDVAGSDNSAGSGGGDDEDVGDSILESDDDIGRLWDDGEDVTSLCEQVLREGDLDVEPDSDTEEMSYRVESPPPAGSAVYKAKIIKSFRDRAIKDDHPRWAKEYLKLPKGYRLVIPAEGSVILDCPPDHIGVYAHHLDFGLRFPLHPFIEKVFRAWNVCLAQVTPQVVRNVVAFTWLLYFKQWPQTINLFRRMIWLKKYKKKSGWWSFYTKASKMTVNPKLSSCKDWEKKFYWLRVPSDFPIRTRFHLPRPHMNHYPIRELGFREKRAHQFVSCLHVDTGLQKSVTVPKYWLPPAKYILGNGPLSAVGLCHTHTLGLHTLNFAILGLGKDGRPTTNNPPNPKGVFSTLSTYATQANKKRGSTREEVVSESPAKKTKRLSSIPAPKPLSIRAPTGVVFKTTHTAPDNPAPKPVFKTVHTAPDMAGGFKSLDCGRGAALTGRRPRDRNQPFTRVNRSRVDGTTQPAPDKSQQKSPEKGIESAADANVAGQGGDAVENVEPIAQPDLMVVDLMTPTRQNQEQEVNDTDVAGMGQKTPPLMPPTLHTSSGYVRPSQSAGTSSGLNMGVFVRPGEWIEKTPVCLTPRKMKYFEVPPGEPDESWNPKIDLLRGESILTDDCKGGGCMGWRALKDLATPRDNPAAEIDAPAAQHMNDLLKACNSAVELVKLYLCYQEQNEDLQKRQAELEKQVNDAKQDLDQKTSELKRVKQRNQELENVANKLEAEETKNKELSEKLLEADEKAKAAYKTGARDGALRFSRSQTYSNRITDSHNGGWFAAHRCGVHGIGLTKEDCEDIEYAFLVEEKHRVPTGWESQIIPEEIIQNADPLTLPPIELKEEDYLDPALPSSSTNQTDHQQV